MDDVARRRADKPDFGPYQWLRITRECRLKGFEFPASHHDPRACEYGGPQCYMSALPISEMAQLAESEGYGVPYFPDAGFVDDGGGLGTPAHLHIAHENCEVLSPQRWLELNAIHREIVRAEEFAAALKAVYECKPSMEPRLYGISPAETVIGGTNLEVPKFTFELSDEIKKIANNLDIEIKDVTVKCSGFDDVFVSADDEDEEK